MVTIYNCIFEPAGRRAERFLEFMADVIAIEVNSNPGPASSYLEINLLAFSQVVELNSTAFIQDPLKQLAHRFAHLLTILYTLDCAVSVGQSIQYLEILQRRFHIGLSLPDILGSLKKSPSPQTTAAFVMRRDPPGGRHDNDHPEISNIQIMPTFAEIASTRTEYLLLKDPRQWHIGGLSVILDRNFRLLREDTIGQLRDVVHTELQHDNLQTSRKNQARTHVYQKATVNSLHLGRFSGMQFLVSYDRQTSFALKRRNEKSGGNFPSGCSQMRLFVSWIQRDMQYSAQCLLSAGTGEGKAPMPASGRCPHRFQRALAMPL